MGERKTQRIYECHTNYALSKIIVDNGLEDLWRRKISDSSEFNCYDRSSGTRSKMGIVYIDINIARNARINHITVSFTDHYKAILIDTLPSKSKIGKYSWYFNNCLTTDKRMLLHVTYEFQSQSTLCSLPGCKGTPCSRQTPYLKFK